MEKKYLDYNESKSWERFKHTIKSWKYIGVGKSLLIWFLAISFIPLATVGLVNYLNSYKGLTIVADKSLKSSSQLRLKYLNTYFEEATDLLEITEMSEVQRIYFEELKNKFNESGLDANSFVNSDEWNFYTEKHRKDFATTLKKKDFYNFMFITVDGDVLFSVKNEKLLGANLFNEDFSHTKLAKSTLKAIENNKTYFSDLEALEASMGIISGFFVMPQIIDNKINGVFALQITMEGLNAMIQQQAGYGETGQAFIIGKDLYLRSTQRFGNDSDILSKQILNKKTKMWKDFLIHKDDASYLKEHELDEESATNYDPDGSGNFVLGIYRNIDYLDKYGVNWAMIEEIEHEEAFMYLRELSDIIKISFLITILIVILISILVTRSFVNPIKQLSSWGKQVAIGELDIKKIKAPENEIGDMSHTFNTLVVSLQSYANVAKSMAKGDFSETVEVRSKDDILGKSMNEMVKSFVSVVNQADTISKGDFSAVIKPRSQNDSLGKALFKMTETLRTNSIEIKRQDWLKTGYNELGNAMTGSANIKTLSDNALNFYCSYLNAHVGILFVKDKNQMIPTGNFAINNENNNFTKPIAEGEGLIGQVFRDKKPIIIEGKSTTDLPLLDFGIEKKPAVTYLINPIIHEGEIIGILLLGTLIPTNEDQLEFINESLQHLAITIITVQSHLRVKELLNRTQEQANELEVQQEELRQSNEELHEQTRALKNSEENLQSQKEELKVTNEELEERSKALEIQRDAIKRKNKELEIARQEIENKANHIAQASQYKSEFLANMSHELRTPLNSIIVLSQLLAENKKIHLDDKELQFAETINSSGNDLLDLINDILDLSKVESGKIELSIERLYFSDLRYYVDSSFKPLLDKKGLKLNFNIDTDKLEFIETDSQRVQQIIKNLFSNAIKFTERGSITLNIKIPDKKFKFSNSKLRYNNSIIISVTDTGIGIPKEKQDVIFEAFKQADGTTSRKYGGTGLGLSISRNFASLLGGEMLISSEENIGSEFSVILPLNINENDASQKTEDNDLSAKSKKQTTSQDFENTSPKVRLLKKSVEIKDDRDNINENDKVILIIEDDYNFARVLLSLGHEHGFKGLIAIDGESGIYFADYYKPKAIILDIGLPIMDGYQVMEKLKINSKTRHIPVHFISAANRNIDALKMGAIGYLTKPAKKEQIESVFSKIESLISKPVKKLLIVEDEAIMRKSIVELMKGDNIAITEVETGADALEKIKTNDFDCMILDLGLSDMTGFELLENLNKESVAHELPIIIYTGKELSKDENYQLEKYSQSIILKGAHSFERLLAETTLFLHQVESKLPNEQRRMLEKVHGKENVLEGKTILVVDDDMRNVFALSSLLENNNIKVIVGKNGIEGIAQLEKHDNIDLVLMDIMMPEMDGYEAMTLIRKKLKWKKLPIIALTAKAMKEDRQKSLDAGANEYLSKPVEKDKLISLLRVWLYK